MNNPGLLLVYRAAKGDGCIAAFCVCCDIDSPESWERYGQWNGIGLDSGTAINFRLSVTDVSGGPFGPVEVYGEEEFMKSVAKRDRIPIMVAQNATYLEIDEACGELKCPFFVSLDVPTTPCSFQATLEMAIKGIHCLPEVLDYDKQMKASFTDKWDAMAHAPLGQSVPFPIGCRLPGTMISGNRECGIVYMLLEEPRNGIAKVHIESSDSSVPLEANVDVVRRFRGSAGQIVETPIGRLVTSP